MGLSLGSGFKHWSMTEMIRAEYLGVSGLSYLLAKTDDLLSKGNFL